MKLRRIVTDGATAELDEPAARHQYRLAFWLRRGWERDNLGVDDERRTISHAGRSLRFSKREFQLLRFLLDHPHRGVHHG